MVLIKMCFISHLADRLHGSSETGLLHCVRNDTGDERILHCAQNDMVIVGVRRGRLTPHLTLIRFRTRFACRNDQLFCCLGQ